MDGVFATILVSYHMEKQIYKLLFISIQKNTRSEQELHKLTNFK